jgi:hypothetical protein
MPRVRQGSPSQPGFTPGISRTRTGRRRCTESKLLKLTPEQSTALLELSAAWGLSGSETLKRLLMQAHQQWQRREVAA